MNDIIYAGKHPLIRSVDRHCHSSWEFIYCTGGTGELVFEGLTVPYSKGDIAVIPPMIPHSNISSEGFTNIHINMLDPTLTIKSPTIIKDDSNQFILAIFEASFFHFYTNRPEKTAFLSNYGNLLSTYLTAYQTSQPHSHVVDEIENNIIRNYADPNFELDIYLRSFPFSYDYLRKLFKKEIGVTPHKYLNDKRLQIAAESLSSSCNDGYNIAEIARQCGFREPLYFSRMFKKKYGVAPRNYIARGAARISEEVIDNVKILID
ncbi:MAG: helix-turn-helix transcriptional regulator [Oscillospiraceae bacterium]|nr:helix-turn-helix transcriptional regulator [Oscillospiraceae bacterium]